MKEPCVTARSFVRDGVIVLSVAGLGPFLAGFLIKIPPGPVLALVSATFILEYAAVFVGQAFGMGNIITLVIVTLVAAGIIFFQLSLFDHAGNSSPRVARFLERIRGKFLSSPLIKKYGVLALIPGMLVVGFYVCPAAAWLAGWERKTAFIVMIGTFCAASAFLLPVSQGIIQWIAGTGS